MKVSVCIPTYNGEKYIKEQIESILPQLSEEDELVISDDSSSDRTVEIIRNFGDSRIKLFTGQQFKSVVRNIEVVIAQAQGDIILLSDQDDVWTANKVEKMIEALATADVVVSDCIVVDQNFSVIHPSYFAHRNSGAGLVKNLLVNTYLGCCIGFRSSIKKKILPFPARIPMHDMWIGMVGELFYRTMFIDEKLMYYRRHEENVTSLEVEKNTWRSFIKRLRYRFNLVRYAPLAWMR